MHHGSHNCVSLNAMPSSPPSRNLFSYLEYNLHVSLLQVTIIRNLAVGVISLLSARLPYSSCSAASASRTTTLGCLQTTLSCLPHRLCCASLIGLPAASTWLGCIPDLTVK
jgi:hypothetical protein